MPYERYAWDRPPNSRIPNRPGDRLSEPLFLSLGKAVSAWEGVQAATSSLYFAMSAPELDEVEKDPGFQAFGGLNKVHERRKELMKRGEEFVSRGLGKHQDQASNFKRRLKSVMHSYVGWAARRNDIAHGYVTESGTPDYDDPDQPTTIVYSLCPSHARLSKWSHGEPEYNYVASELEYFASCFQHLDERIEDLARFADRLSRARAGIG